MSQITAFNFNSRHSFTLYLLDQNTMCWWKSCVHQTLAEVARSLLVYPHSRPAAPRRNPPSPPDSGFVGGTGRSTRMKGVEEFYEQNFAVVQRSTLWKRNFKKWWLTFSLIFECNYALQILYVQKKAIFYLTVPSEDAVNNPLSSLDQQRSYTTLRWPLKDAKTFPDGISYTKNRHRDAKNCISLNYIQEYSICRNWWLVDTYF